MDRKHDPSNKDQDNVSSIKADVARSQRSRTPDNIEYVIENSNQNETILLIHGACASGSDWSLVVPYLSSYHLLIPSLFKNASLNVVRQSRRTPQSPQSRSPSLQRWDSCFIFHLAELVRKCAKRGRAHIVGLSFGGCLAAKMIAVYPELCLSLLVSGLPMLVSPPLYSIMKPVGTGFMWLSHAIVKVVGGKNVNRFMEGEVDTDPGAWDGKGGGSTVEMNGILSETIIYDSKGEYYVERMREKPSEDTTFAGSRRIRFIAASRKSRWTPVSDSPEWAVEVAKIMLGQRKSAADTAGGETVAGVDCKVYEARQMFHPWSRQDPEMFAQCILATVLGTDFPSQGLEEVWRYPTDAAERVQLE